MTKAVYWGSQGPYDNRIKEALGTFWTPAVPYIRGKSSLGVTKNLNPVPLAQKGIPITQYPPPTHITVIKRIFSLLILLSFKSIISPQLTDECIDVNSFKGHFVGQIARVHPEARSVIVVANPKGIILPTLS